MRRFADQMAWAEDSGGFAIHAAVNERVGFIRKTYAHLAVELLGVFLVAWMAVTVPALRAISVALLTNILFYIAAIFGVSFVSRKLMEGNRAVSTQYFGAGLWVFFLGMLVAPLALIAEARFGSLAVLGEAFVLTGCVFGGLTAYVFISKKDFSFMGSALAMISMIMFGVMIISAFMGGLPSIWSLLMVVLMGGWVLYDTSNVLKHRRVDQYVAASVDLLVDFVYMFFHIALLLMSGRD